MNKRQLKKKLKRQIARLKSDNALMRSIIDDCPAMAEQYAIWSRPLNVVYSQVQLNEYKSERPLPLDYNEAVVEAFKHTMESEIFELVKSNVTYEVSTEYFYPTLIGSIFIGRKGEFTSC